MKRYFIAIGAWAMLASTALADHIDLTNNVDTPIYKLYAWPTDLDPRTVNILNEPLFPRSTGQVEVDNPYSDCSFTFEYDPNSPDDLKRKSYQRKPLVTFQTDLCIAKGKLIIENQEL